MRLCLILCALLLSACGLKQPERVVAAPYSIPPDLLTPSPGWEGARPTREGQYVDAAAAEKEGREDANAKIKAIAKIVAP